jgi:hypothetical protein
MGKFAPVARFSRDDLLLTLCVGQHNIITTLTNDELITGVGGDAYDPQPALPQRSARNHRERLAAYAPRCPRFTPGPSFDPRGASKNAQTRPFRRGKGQSRGALSTGETIEH